MRTTVVLALTRNQSWNVGSVARMVTSKGIAVVVKRTTQMLVVWEKGLRTNPKTKVNTITWWIDSGATTHVCKDRCWFKTYEPVEDGSILYMGDDHFTPVYGKGSVALEFSSRKTITLFNVLYIPKLRKNLVSSLMLNKCGYKQVYESDKYIFSKSCVFVGFGYYNNGMFMLNLDKVPDDSDSVYMSFSTIVNSSLWHTRLGHVHYKRILEMSKDDLIPAIDENLEKCTTCMLTKITRQPFKSITRKSVILELIHSDLCDFHATPSLGNKKYVITFIDDASRFCDVYLLHAKDEALDKYRIYKTEVELQQNDLIKTLRTDRGGEYYDPVFFQFVRIIHETTTLYTPQQNGVAKRKNRALKEMVNSMLSNKTTPYELWYKKRPNLSFLRVWGCRAVVRLPDPKRKTLGEKGIDCIFVGYAEHSKAYRFYVIELNDSISINSIIESRDVIFDENRFSLIPRPKDIIPNVQESQMDDHTDDVPNEIPKPRRGKRIQKAKSYGFDFQLYLVEGSRDQVGSQYSYCYSIEEDTRTYNEAMQSREAAFWKEAIDDEIVDETKKFLSSRFSMKDMGEANVILGIKIKREKKGIVITQSHYIKNILKKFNREDCSSVSTPMDLVEKLKPNTGKPVDQLEYSRVIGCLMYAMTSTRYLNASWINHVEDSSSTSRWVFLLGGALAVAGKEAEWLRNLIHEIPIWPKPIAPIYIRCDSAPIIARAYSQTYNGKSKHLGVRHGMVRELIKNGVISIKFVRTQHNLADHLTKGLARDLEVRELIRTRRVLDTVLFPPPAQVYSPPKKDMSWTGLPEFADDTITDYSRLSPSIESDSPTVIKINKVKTAKKSSIKYAEMYRNTSKSPKVRGNQRNWNNLKSQQLGKDFLMKNKACFKCGHFDHLAYDCGVWVEKRNTWPKNNFAYKNVTPRADLLKTGRTPIAVNRTNMNVDQPKGTYFSKTTHSYVRRRFQRKSAVRFQSRVPRVSTVNSIFFTTDLGTKGTKGKVVKASACWI
nr:zinc finger, CCHC-type [Tanacetum cinerariifolium]